MKEIPAQLEKHYDDTIFLKEDTWLSFHREHYKGYDDVVIVSLVDGLLETTTVLATYVNGMWKSPNQRSSSLFWTYAKKYNWRMRRIIYKLHTPIPEDIAYRLNMKQFKRRMWIQSRSLIRTLKSIFKH
jgi:hypothetical protein